jgi:uncharacterized membrane protein
MRTIPAVAPRLPRTTNLNRHLPPMTALAWLRAGINDLRVQPGLSLIYGLLVFLMSVCVVLGLFGFGLDYILFPALAGFMVVGPILAVGLYEKSRRIAAGQPVTLTHMLFVKTQSGGQILFVGVMLCGLMLLWMRAAVIIYALFFGLRPFPGLDHVTGMLFTTATGWAMLIVGGAIGGLFAAFAFAISVLSIPMLLNENLDALTAMAMSMTRVWNNLPVMLAWGTIVVGLWLISVLIGMLGLIVVFPLLGHATWHVYKAIR